MLRGLISAGVPPVAGNRVCEARLGSARNRPRAWYWTADVFAACEAMGHLAYPLGNNWGHRGVKSDERDAADLVNCCGWYAWPRRGSRHRRCASWAVRERGRTYDEASGRESDGNRSPFLCAGLAGGEPARGDPTRQSAFRGSVRAGQRCPRSPSLPALPTSLAASQPSVAPTVYAEGQEETSWLEVTW